MTRIRYFVAILLVGAAPGLAVAGSGWFNLFGWHKPADECSSCATCATCRAEIETKKVEKTCFETECKQICVPKITFPWQKHCAHDDCDSGCENSGCCDAACAVPECGRVINVNTLKTRKYECEQTGCKWIIEPGCCDECGAAWSGIVAPPAEQTMPQVPTAPLAPAVPNAAASKRAIQHQPR